MSDASLSGPKSARRLGLALAGVGYWGPNLARNLFQHPRAELRYLCDLDAARLAEVAAGYPGVQATGSLEEVLADPSVEAVVVATPAGTHRAVAGKVLEAGRHVLVEKPLAATSRDAAELVLLARERGLTLMVGHTYLYNPAARRVKELIDAGDLGEVFYLHSRRVNLGRRQTDINAFWSIAPHDVSLFNRWLGGPPEFVQATGAAYLSQGVEDVVFATLFYSGGRLAHIHASWLDPAKRREITIVGSQKMVVYDELDPEGQIRIYDQGPGVRPPERFYGDYQARLRAGDILIPRLKRDEPLAVEIDHFIQCVLERREPLSGGVDGLEVAAVCEAAAESLRRGGERVAPASARELLGDV
jgi:predicted dehydrogenase